MKCPICDSSSFHWFLNPYRGSSIYQCDNCTNAVTVPAPIIVYQKDRFYQKGQVDKQAFTSYAQLILGFLKKAKPGGKLLDIGCGAGYLLEEAEKAGYESEGLDVSRGAVEWCKKRQLKVRQGYFGIVKYPENYFDILVASHVLEHNPNAHLFLKNCQKLLKKDGLLFLSQTNYTGSVAKLLGRYWESWVPSEHYYHFSPLGIEYLLSNNKFRIKKLSLLPLGYKIICRFGSFPATANSFYNSFNYLISRFKLIPSFSGDQMYILARKNP